MVARSGLVTLLLLVGGGVALAIVIVRYDRNEEWRGNVPERGSADHVDDKDNPTEPPKPEESPRYSSTKISTPKDHDPHRLGEKADAFAVLHDKDGGGVLKSTRNEESIT